MADQDVKQLLLQVDASIELLRSNLGKADVAVKGSTDRWGKDADRADASFSKVGGGLNGIGSRLREINNLTKQYGATSAAAAAKAAAMQRQLQSQSDQIANGLRRAGGVVGTYFGVRELTQINDRYIEFTNGLRVAGVEAGQTKVVQDALFASAQKYGIELNSLGTLFSRASQASQTLGASQSDLLRFSDGVSAALKVQGGSTESASGALLQLSQALQAGTVRAEEFNSINEGAFPILQAVAAGSARFAGSVASLRAEVLKGTVSSKEFFQSFLAGAPMLEERAAKATLTTAAGFVTLRNALEVYVGEANNSSGASAALGSAMQSIAENIDIVLPAIAAIGVALGVGFVANALKAGVAARGAGGAMLAAFGGPVGIAVTAVALSVGSFGAEVARVDSLVSQANLQYDAMEQKLKAAAVAAGSAASGNAAVGTDALGAIPKVNSFAGAVGELAQKLYDQARAARAARKEMLQTQLTESQSKERELAAATASGRAQTQSGASDAFRDGNVARALRITRDNLVGGLRSLFTGGQSDRDAAHGYNQQVLVSRQIQAELAKASNPATITAADLPGGGVSVASGAAGKKGPKGPSAETLAKREEAARQRDVRDDAAYAAELRRSRMEELALQADATNDQATRADIERQRVALERDQFAKEIAADGPAKAGGTGRYSDAQVEELQVINRNIAQAKLAAIDTTERRRLASDQLALAQADRDNQADLLSGSLDLATTMGERRDLEIRILNLQIEEERARLEAVTLANGANATEVKIAQARLAMLERIRGQETERITRETESPIDQRRRQVRATTASMNDAIQNIELDALDRFTDGLANASTEFVKLGGIAGDVVNSIISDLVRLAAQQAIFGTGGSGGFLTGIGSLLGFSRGGSTGDIPENQVAGVVHGGEYVFDAQAVKRIGRDELESMRSGSFRQPSVSTATMNGAGSLGGAGVARVELMLSDDLDGRIQSVSGNVAVQVYQAGSRAMVEVAKAETIREMTRNRM